MSNEVVGMRVAEMVDGVGMRVATPRHPAERVLRSESVLDSESAASELARALPWPWLGWCEAYEMRLDARDGDDDDAAADDESRDLRCVRYAAASCTCARVSCRLRSRARASERRRAIALETPTVERPFDGGLGGDGWDEWAPLRLIICGQWAQVSGWTGSEGSPGARLACLSAAKRGAPAALGDGGAGGGECAGFEAAVVASRGGLRPVGCLLVGREGCARVQPAFYLLAVSSCPKRRNSESA